MSEIDLCFSGSSWSVNHTKNRIKEVNKKLEHSEICPTIKRTFKKKFNPRPIKRRNSRGGIQSLLILKKYHKIAELSEKSVMVVGEPEPPKLKYEHAIEIA